MLVEVNKSKIISSTLDFWYLLPSPGSFSSLTDMRSKRDSRTRVVIEENFESIGNDSIVGSGLSVGGCCACYRLV